MFDTLKSFLKPQQRTAVKVVTVNSPVNYEEIPKGFFRVCTASGTESLGYRFADGALNWNVGFTVVDGSQRVTLSVPLAELPIVKLNYQRPVQGGGSQFIGGQSIIDTDSLEEDTTVRWDGAKPASGVGWV
jgi:hypothetical protein